MGHLLSIYYSTKVNDNVPRICSIRSFRIQDLNGTPMRKGHVGGQRNTLGANETSDLSPSYLNPVGLQPSPP